MRALRTLVVLRHSKAMNPFGVADHDRPLSDRGRRDASAAGAWLAKHGLRPDLVLCSPALRTRQTLDELALDAVVDVDLDPRIYSAEVESLRELIAEVPDEVGTLLLIGHNPAVHQLVFDLTGAESEGFPTTALAVLRIQDEDGAGENGADGAGGSGQAGGWSALRPGACRLETLHTARG